MIAYEQGQIDRTQQTGAMGRQRLLATGVGGADLFTEPVVVHLVDSVDQDEPGLGEVVGGGHDHVPDPTCLEHLGYATGHTAILTGQVTLGSRQLAPDHLIVIVQIQAIGIDFGLGQGEGQLPVGVGSHSLHEVLGDQQRQVELTQPAALALGTDEIHHVRMADIKGRHLRATTATGGRHGEAHLVVDIHERQRA